MVQLKGEVCHQLSDWGAVTDFAGCAVLFGFYLFILFYVPFECPGRCLFPHDDFIKKRRRLVLGAL